MSFYRSLRYKMIFISCMGLFWSTCGAPGFDTQTSKNYSRSTSSNNDANQADDTKTDTKNNKAVVKDECGLTEESLPNAQKSSLNLVMAGFSKSFPVMSKTKPYNLIQTAVQFSGNAVWEQGLEGTRLSFGLAASPLLSTLDFKNFLGLSSLNVAGLPLTDAEQQELKDGSSFWKQGHCVLTPATQLTKVAPQTVQFALSEAVPFGLNVAKLALNPAMIDGLANVPARPVSLTVKSSQDKNMTIGKVYLGSFSLEKTSQSTNPTTQTTSIAINFDFKQDAVTVGLPARLEWVVQKTDGSPSVRQLKITMPGQQPMTFQQK
jgi:hypothetical protein